jgi:ParB family transcriptional regulator, chromosome partitioning protein
MSKPSLGRGLGVLLGGVPAARKATAPAAQVLASPDTSANLLRAERVERVALSRIRPCPYQPRKDFPEEALRELADSIREQGIVQPLIVRARAEGFELIAGERRWRAAQLAGLAEVPVLVREADDTAALELALIENLQRENLNPVEEAQGYQQLLDQFHLRQEDIAAKVGKSRVAVTNALRLLRLPAEVQAYLRSGRLSVGHAKVILGLNRPEDQNLAAEQAIRDGLNVRQTEDLVARFQPAGNARPEGPAAARATGAARDVHVMALESRLQERLGTKVGVRYRHGRGAIEIRFFSPDDLNRLLDLLGVKAD